MGDVSVLPTPDVVVPARAVVGEGPVFDERTGRLCWVDINEGMLLENDLTNGTQTVTQLSMMLGAAAPRAHAPGFAVAVADGFGFVQNGKLEIVDPVLPEAHRRMNDAKCDSAGRLWAGSNHMEFVPGIGALHRWDGSSPGTVVLDGLILPNGLGWNPADTTMYLVDSFANTLMSASFDAADGTVGTFDVLAKIESGLPDGLAVDVDGCIWVAVWGGWEVLRISPEGEVVAKVPMPVAQPSSCAFGADGALYITSASNGLDEKALAEQPHAGSVFAVASGTHGVPVSAFAG
jgi:sugar lactone lactonase YvrE